MTEYIKKKQRAMRTRSSSTEPKVILYQIFQLSAIRKTRMTTKYGQVGRYRQVQVGGKALKMYRATTGGQTTCSKRIPRNMFEIKNSRNRFSRSSWSKAGMCFFFRKPIFGSCSVHWIAGEAKFKSIAAKSPRPDGVHYVTHTYQIYTLKRRL